MMFNLKFHTMKKMMIIAAMMVAAVSANAQFEPGTFSIQPKLGSSISWLSNTPNIPIGDIGSKSIELDKLSKRQFFFIKGNKKRKNVEENMGDRYIGQMNSGDTHGEPV